MIVDQLMDLCRHVITNIRRDWKLSMSEVYPVLLAGGSGTRLWPLLRKSYLKQFSELIG